MAEVLSSNSGAEVFSAESAAPSEFNGESLFLDFEQELADLFRGNPNRNSGRRGSTVRGYSTTSGRSRSSSITSNFSSVAAGLLYEPDGTVLCSNIDFQALLTLTGRNSLESMKALSLCVSSYDSFDNLRILSMYTPTLTSLTLDHSRFGSLRVLGDELPSLTSLSVSDCGIHDLNGITYATNLVTFVAANNRIDDLLAITELPKIKTIDLENNAVQDFDTVSFLFLCPKLTHLVLKKNPVAYEYDYRETIFMRIPQLKKLDVAVVANRLSFDLCRRFRKKEDKDDDEDEGGGEGQQIPKEDPKPKEEETMQELAPAEEIKKLIEKKEKIEEVKPEEVKKVEDAPEIAEETKKEIKDQTSSKEEQIEEKIKVIPETPDKVSKPILSVRQRQKPPTSKAQAQQPPIKFEFGSRPQGLSSKLLDKRHRADPLKVEAFNEPLSLVDDGIEEKTVKKDEDALKDLFEGGQTELTSVGPLSLEVETDDASSISLATDSGISSKNASDNERIPRVRMKRRPNLLRNESFVEEPVLGKPDEKQIIIENQNQSGIKSTEGDLEIEDFEG